MLSKRVNGHHSTCTVANSDLLLLIHTQSYQLSFRNAGQSALFTNSRIPSQPCLPPIWNGVSTGFEIPPIPRYQHPITSPDLPYPYFPFSPLAAPANTGASLPLQLMKATVLAESYHILSTFIAMCRLQRCVLTVAR
jgi:hypothetical protein